jgi:BMFP domain-containing protein YqiC
MNDNSIEGLAKKLADSLPGGLRSMRDDLEQNFRSVEKQVAELEGSSD